MNEINAIDHVNIASHYIPCVNILFVITDNYNCKISTIIYIFCEFANN